MEEVLCTELVAGHQALPNRTEGGNELRYIQDRQKVYVASCHVHLYAVLCLARGVADSSKC